MENLTITKQEILSNQKIISGLFADGNSFLAYPLKIVFIKSDSTNAFPAQAAFAVSKRNFKRANKRNYLKRLMREAYRLNKSAFYGELALIGANINLMVVYIGKELCEYKTVEKAMISAFKKLQAKLNSMPKKNAGNE